jgi:glutamate-1-semialdehyde 2,1-aminomutase
MPEPTAPMPMAPQAGDAALRERAARVIPGGLWGHMRAQLLPPAYPQFFARAEGCRLWDADGREFIDFMCSWGPVVLGHHDPDVDAAAAAQARAGDLMNGPAPVLVELAEHFTALVAHADWVMFAKNGTDATTACVTIARAATQRRKVLVARGAYHGAAPWCTPNPAGVLPEDRAHLIAFRYNDGDSLEQAARQAGDDLAAVLVAPLRHDYGVDQELVQPAFAHALRALCDRSGAALILDEVRAGARIDLAGSWEPIGVRPDLAAWSKAIANGHALAAVTGAGRWRDAAASIFVTGSFWCGAVAMAAGLATLRKLQAVDGIAHMRAMGERLRTGLDAQARAHGFSIRQTGPAQLPMLRFDDDPDAALGTAFCALALEHGVYLHPRHNLFLSVAHRAQDIDQALEGTERAFVDLARRVGR